MTADLPPSEQGKLQGANGSLLGIAGLVGPAIFTLIFAACIGQGAPLYLPGAPFLLAAFVLLASLGLAAAVTRPASNATSS